MKIAFFLTSVDNKGGVERSLTSLLNALVTKKDIEIHLILLSYTKEAEAFELNNKIIIHNLNIKNYKYEWFKLNSKLFKLLKKHSFNSFVTVEIMSMIFTYIPLQFFSKKTKNIIWEHFNFFNNNGISWRKKLRYFAAKKTDQIVTLTKRDMDTWQEKLNPKATISYIYNISPYQNIKHEYDVNSKIAISVGRYVEVKGFERLIDAWSLMVDKYKIFDWQLQIIGSGPLYEKLNKKILDTGKSSIFLIDGKNKMQNYYEKAAFLCCSSYYEGLPMTMIEAQSFHLPLIAYDIYTGPNEIIDKNAGLLVKDGEIEDYANSLFQLIKNTNLRLQMSNNAKKLMDRFKSDDIVEKWLMILKN